jgi:hypothetical protein
MNSDFSQRESETLENKRIPLGIKRKIVFNKINSYRLFKLTNQKISNIVGNSRKRNTKMIKNANEKFIGFRVNQEDLKEALRAINVN